MVIVSTPTLDIKETPGLSRLHGDDTLLTGRGRTVNSRGCLCFVLTKSVCRSHNGHAAACAPSSGQGSPAGTQTAVTCNVSRPPLLGAQLLGARPPRRGTTKPPALWRSSSSPLRSRRPPASACAPALAASARPAPGDYPERCLGINTLTGCSYIMSSSPLDLSSSPLPQQLTNDGSITDSLCHIFVSSFHELPCIQCSPPFCIPAGCLLRQSNKHHSLARFLS